MPHVSTISRSYDRGADRSCSKDSRLGRRSGHRGTGISRASSPARWSALWVTTLRARSNTLWGAILRGHLLVTQTRSKASVAATASVKMATKDTVLEAELDPNVGSSHRKPKSPSGVPVSQITPKIFPLPMSESFKHWWKQKSPLEVQDELLSTLPFYVEPSATHSSEVVSFKSPNSLVFPDINEFYVKPRNDSANDQNAKHLVIIHGYGAGLGFFEKNIESLALRHPNWHIHAIDLPGYGCSTRVDFPHKIPYENHKTVEKLFTVPLRDWFVARGLSEKNTLAVAHSMGGYLSLLLQMNEVTGEGFISKDEYKMLKRRFGCDSAMEEAFQRQAKELSGTAANPRRFWDTLIQVSPGGIFHSRAKQIEENTPKWFTRLWNWNVSPFSLVRNSGPLGSYFVSGWTNRRLGISSLFNEEDVKLLHRYSYAIFNAKGSGEYMLNYILAPGGVPRHPLVERLGSLGKFAGRTLWMYGDHDWMDYKGGVLACEELKAAGSPDAHLQIVAGAGHHVYLDAFKSFNQIVGREMARMENK